MAITWGFISKKVVGNLLTLTIQEVIDAVPGKKYSVTRPRDHARSLFRSDLKKMVLKDREDQAAEEAEPETNMAGFETFLKS